MKAETLIDAIGNLSDALILECENIKKLAEKKRYSRIIWSAAAACLCFAILAGGYFLSRPVVEEQPKLVGGNWHPRDHVIDFVPERKETEAPDVTAVPTEIPTAEPEETPDVVETPALPEEMTVETEIPETDWEPMWTYFIARLESEKGEGITSFWGGTANAAEGHYLPGYSDEFFIEHSSWVFEFDYGEGHYIARKSALSEGDIGECLGKIILDINETKLKYLHYQKELYAYAINNISTKAAIAVCVDSGEYYLFVNTKYEENSFEEFLTDFNLLSTTRLTRMAKRNEDYTATIYDITDDGEIWDILLSYDSRNEIGGGNRCINIEMNNDFYCFYNSPLILYENGCINFHAMRNSYTFFVDEEIIDRILELYETKIENNDSTEREPEL